MENLKVLEMEQLENIDAGGVILGITGGIIGISVGSIIGGSKAIYDGVTGHGNEAGSDMFAAMKGAGVVGAIAGSCIPMP